MSEVAATQPQIDAALHDAPVLHYELEPWSRVFWRNLTDLTPLKSTPLESLTIAQTPITDLSPLKGMKLTGLNCNHCPVSDLSPLRGMPLVGLDMCLTKVTDLSPLNTVQL